MRLFAAAFFVATQNDQLHVHAYPLYLYIACTVCHYTLRCCCCCSAQVFEINVREDLSTFCPSVQGSFTHMRSTWFSTPSSSSHILLFSCCLIYLGWNGIDFDHLEKIKRLQGIKREEKGGKNYLMFLCVLKLSRYYACFSSLVAHKFFCVFFDHIYKLTRSYVDSKICHFHNEFCQCLMIVFAYRQITILLLQTHVICGNLICFLSSVNHIYFQSHRRRGLEWTPFFHHIYLHGHKPNETSSIIFISYPFYHLSGENKFVFFIFQAFLNTHNFHAT